MLKQEVIKKSQGITLVLNVVLATFAFAFLLSASVPSVSATGTAGGAVTTVGPTGSGGPIAWFKAKPVTGGKLTGVLGKAFIWAAIAYLVAPMLADLLGLDEGEADALQAGLTAGVFAYQALSGVYVTSGAAAAASTAAAATAAAATTATAATTAASAVATAASTATATAATGLATSTAAASVTASSAVVAGTGSAAAAATAAGTANAAAIAAYGTGSAAASATGAVATTAATSSAAAGSASSAAAASTGGFGSGALGAAPLWPALVIIAIVIILTYTKQKIKYVQYQCLPWEAPIGGNNCEDCNDGIHACSEYRCKSLGQACEIVNAGTDDELCVWKNKRDVNSALITPWEEVLTEPYVYANTNSRPPSWGTEIVPNNDVTGCIQAFDPMDFGILTNKPTQCKIDFEYGETFEDMEFYFGSNNLFSYNHTQKMNVPNARTLLEYVDAQDQEATGGLAEGIDIENANNYNLYVRCTTANGFYNVDPYVIRFCVDDGPDATPPYIVETSIRNNQPVQYEVDTVPIEVYTNEPTNCKWSRLDQDYNDMENVMFCKNDIKDLNSDLLYTCEDVLTGLQDRQENKYYFRCQDQPLKPQSERGVMTQSYILTLFGTEPLNIKEGSVMPVMNTIVEGATSSVEVTLEVETENGYDKGAATCFYSIGEDGADYITFLNTDSHTHSQRQDLESGTYTYNFRCVDAGGNTAEASTTFDVFVDTLAPVVVRILYTSNNLQIITDEDATCRFTTDPQVQCNFDLNALEGSAMQHPNQDRKNEHLTSWNVDDTYYIKCKDDNDKQPGTQCSIIVRPVEATETL